MKKWKSLMSAALAACMVLNVPMSAWAALSDYDEETAARLQDNKLEFDEIEAQEIITPRVDMITLDVEDSWKEAVELAKESKVSRIPVYEGSIDNIIGVIHVLSLIHI